MIIIINPLYIIIVSLSLTLLNHCYNFAIMFALDHTNDKTHLLHTVGRVPLQAALFLIAIPPH